MTLTVHNVEQGTEAWHDLRRGIVTASSVGKLIGYDDRDPAEFDCITCGATVGGPCVSIAKGKTGPLKTYHPPRYAAAREAGPALTVGDVDDLAYLLASERITGRTEDTFTTEAMWRGIEDEPRARDKYSETYAPVTECGFMVDDRWGFAIGFSPDGLVGDDGLIEVKSRAPKTQVKTVVTGDVPSANYAQLQCGLLVSGRDWCDYLSYAGGMHLYRHRVYPEQQWFDVIVAAAERLERRITEMVTAYNERVFLLDMPFTERVDDSEIRI